eukprot:GHVL01010376.1.p1 GENE.GHVL01010376.1~~GHVL01010376.1.p1  ORF type:complete len:114 (+),score=12.27 GHVL01010376.1:478-819(+)
MFAHLSIFFSLQLSSDEELQALRSKYTELINFCKNFRSLHPSAWPDERTFLFNLYADNFEKHFKVFQIPRKPDDEDTSKKDNLIYGRLVFGMVAVMFLSVAVVTKNSPISISW